MKCRNCSRIDSPNEQGLCRFCAIDAYLDHFAETIINESKNEKGFVKHLLVTLYNNAYVSGRFKNEDLEQLETLVATANLTLQSLDNNPRYALFRAQVERANEYLDKRPNYIADHLRR